MKKSIAKIYTPFITEPITLQNLVYQTDDKIKEYLEKNEIDWQRDLVHIPDKFWDEKKIHEELIRRILPNNMEQYLKVHEILNKNHIIPTDELLNGLVINNAEFGKLCKHDDEFVKFIMDGMHHGIKYDENGNYEDYIPLIPNGEKGGLTFTTSNIGYSYNSYANYYASGHKFMANIFLRDGWTVFQNDRFKTTSFYLENIR